MELKLIPMLAGVMALTVAATPEVLKTSVRSLPDDFSISGGKTEAMIPFEYPQHEIVMAVMVNGRGPFHFLFDTGADLAVSRKVATTLGLSVKEGEVRGQGVGEAPVIAGSTQLSSLQLGAVTLKNQRASVLPLASGFDGNIGERLMRRLVGHIDFERQVLTLTRHESFVPPQAATRIPLVTNPDRPNAGPFVHGKIDGIPGLFLVDLGANGGAMLNSPFSLTHHLLDTTPGASNVAVGSGNGGLTRSVRAQDLPFSLGTISFGPVPTNLSLQKSGILADASYSGLVGTRVWEHYNLTLDYADQLLYLEPRALH